MSGSIFHLATCSQGLSMLRRLSECPSSSGWFNITLHNINNICASHCAYPPVQRRALSLLPPFGYIVNNTPVNMGVSVSAPISALFWGYAQKRDCWATQEFCFNCLRCLRSIFRGSGCTSSPSHEQGTGAPFLDILTQHGWFSALWMAATLMGMRVSTPAFR